MTGLELDGARVVVTGGGSGIGAALATAFAQHGAHVIVNDLDPRSAAQVAESIGGLAIAGDVTNPVAVSSLVDAAYRELGGLDLFCANAGVGGIGGLDAAPAERERSWQVNVLSHVYAAQALLPRWLEAGRGRLLTTVSAAGLLSMIGSAPYAVTKHAALAFAEWLRITYAHRGITVQALCPQGVDTPMLRGTGPIGEALLRPGALAPAQLAAEVVAGLGDDRFLILPHPEVADFYARRAADPDGWLASMGRIQQRLERS